jgi:hypothetical protein
MKGTLTLGQHLGRGFFLIKIMDADFVHYPITTHAILLSPKTLYVSTANPKF